MAQLAIRAAVALALLAAVVVGCRSEPERPQIALNANAVGGGLIEIDDLAGTDTVLWFWAPW